MQITDFIQYAGWLAAGAFAIFTAWDKASRGRHQDADQTANNLITNLKTAVDLQEKQLKEYHTKLEITSKELHQMQGRNSVLENLFNGSENSILAFLKETPKLMRISEESRDAAVANAAAIAALTNAITMLITKLTPQTEKTTTVVEKTTTPVS